MATAGRPIPSGLSPGRKDDAAGPTRRAPRDALLRPPARRLMPGRRTGRAAVGRVAATIQAAPEEARSYGNPAALAVGDGAVWEATAVRKGVSSYTGEVVRIDAATNQVARAAAVDAEPYAIAFGDGALWVG